jgi:acetyltransferase-like isoleucine patch superfamily enzyme
MIRNLLSKLGGEGFGSELISLRTLVKAFVIQKIFGINRAITWPVHWTSKVSRPDKIERGTRFPGLSMGCHIDGRNGIKFGRNVWVGPRVSVISMNHDQNNYHEYVECGPIIIGDNCWLATNSVLLPEVELGPHTLVAAGAVVTRSFPEGNQLLAGVPAKVIKKLAPYKSEKFDEQ